MIHSRTKEPWIRMIAGSALMLLFLGVARATTIEHMSLARLAQAAPLIVRARCVGNVAVKDAGEIWTLTSFAVEETWRGDGPPQINVRLLGGSIGDITSHVSGVPRFRPGEDVVLFLEPTEHDSFSVVSWEQGTFRIRADASGAQAFVTQDTASFATFDPVRHKFRMSGIRNMPILTFRDRVETALRSASAKRP